MHVGYKKLRDLRPTSCFTSVMIQVSYYGTPIKTRMWSIEWCYFQWPWLTSEGHNILPCQITQKIVQDYTYNGRPIGHHILVYQMVPFSMMLNDVDLTQGAGKCRWGINKFAYTFQFLCFFLARDVNFVPILPTMFRQDTNSIANLFQQFHEDSCHYCHLMLQTNIQTNKQTNKQTNTQTYKQYRLWHHLTCETVSWRQRHWT